MNSFNRGRIRRMVVSVLLVGHLGALSGCATMAHRSTYSASGKQPLVSCDGHTGSCPWLIGDALLLLPGIVPGIVAFAVDFGTGAWHHDNHYQHARTTKQFNLTSVGRRR